MAKEMEYSNNVFSPLGKRSLSPGNQPIGYDREAARRHATNGT